MYQRILIPLDLADNDSVKRLIAAAGEIGKASNAELHALVVVPTYSMSIVGSFFPEDHEKKSLAAATELLAKTLGEHQTETPIKGHVAHGTIYDEIMKAANSLDCQLIVMSAHRPELKDYLLGPNAARVARHAKQSVFIVRD